MGIRDWFRRRKPALRVVVHDHIFQAKDGPVPCWTFVSDGLAKAGHREIVLTLARPADEPVD